VEAPATAVGSLLTTFAWEPSEEYTGVLLRGALLAYAAPDTTTNRKADYAAHYDWFSIWALPSRECSNEISQQSEHLE